MKLQIEVSGNGIHNTYNMSATNIQKEDMDFLKEICGIVDKYQEEAIKNA